MILFPELDGFETYFMLLLRFGSGCSLIPFGKCELIKRDEWDGSVLVQGKFGFHARVDSCSGRAASPFIDSCITERCFDHPSHCV